MLKKFFSYYKPHKRLFIIDFSSAVFVALLELAFPLAVQWFIDELLPTGDWNQIVKISVLLLLVYMLSTLMNFIVNYLGHKLGINILALFIYFIFATISTTVLFITLKNKLKQRAA